VIVLDRTKQTLVARTANAADPVKVVLVSAANAGQTMTNGEQNNSGAGPNKSGKPDTPSVIRVRGGDLKYSDAERKAVMHGGALGSVVAETGDATTHSSEVAARRESCSKRRRERAGGPDDGAGKCNYRFAGQARNWGETRLLQ
jgi:hypothetical protein